MDGWTKGGGGRDKSMIAHTHIMLHRILKAWWQEGREGRRKRKEEPFEPIRRQEITTKQTLKGEGSKSDQGLTFSHESMPSKYYYASPNSPSFFSLCCCLHCLIIRYIKSEYAKRKRDRKKEGKGRKKNIKGAALPLCCYCCCFCCWTCQGDTHSHMPLARGTDPTAEFRNTITLKMDK